MLGLNLSLGAARNRYNPLINYTWSTKVVSGIVYATNSGTGSAYDAKMYSGQGVAFNGVDQSVVVPNVGATSMIYRKDGVVTYTQAPFYTLNAVGKWQDVFYFNRVLTSTEQSYYATNPNEFYQNALTDATCLVNLPMCENDGSVKDMVSGTLYPITNYLSTCRTNAQNLSYGSQQLNFVKDTLGNRLGKSSYLEFDGKSYADTTYIPSGASTVQESIELIFTKAGIAQTSYSKILSGINYSGIFTIEFSNGATEAGHVRYRAAIADGNDFGSTNFINGNLYVTVTTDGTNRKIYFNGVNVWSGVTATVTSTIPYRIGCGSSVSEFINQVTVKLLKIHAKALTQDEITKNYNDAVSKGLLA